MSGPVFPTLTADFSDALRRGAAGLPSLGWCRPARSGAGGYAFHVERLAGFAQPVEWDPFDELVPMDDIEHQHTVPAILQIVANAGTSNVKQPFC